MNVILFLLLLLVFFAVAVILLFIASEFIGDVESPVRRWRKMHTPPCSRCGHRSLERRYFGHDEAYCSCPVAVEAEERMSGRIVRICLRAACAEGNTADSSTATEGMMQAMKRT